jgi:two-component system CheB/CheR fusion protein
MHSIPAVGKVKTVQERAGPGSPAEFEGSGGAEIQSLDRSPETRPPLIVGIGASAGGLEAFKAFFGQMPADSGMAFVLVQHLSPDHKSMLVELLGAATLMTVVEAEDGMALEANRVFVIPPNATLTVHAGRLSVEQPAPPRDHRRPIDTFFVSLAEDQHENAVCIILSGTGSDGTLGLAAIKERGGLTFAQAEFDHQAKPGMPFSAAATGRVDEILQVTAMPAKLIAYQRRLNGPALTRPSDDAHPGEGHLTAICALMLARSGHDFRAYKDKTFVRRMERRMQALEIKTPDAYVAHLRKEPQELDVLFQELLIGVTQFFRDPAAFEVLQATILKGLVKGNGADQQIRIWVPGCATGQEVFTLAMLLRECMDFDSPQPKVQIFGTDIDERALARARRGRYAKTLAGVSPERLERWFIKDGDGYSVLPEIREMCLFSIHSVIKDPPFSKLNLISCRNLLIYLEPDAQDRVMRTFHYALNPGGTLFLGASESVTRSTKLFSVVDKKHRIFERCAIQGLSLPDLTPGRRAARPPKAADSTSNPPDDSIDKDARRLIEKYAPAHLVVDRGHQIVRFSGGDLGAYLEPALGAPSFNLFNLLRKTLRPAVRAALQEAQTTGAPVLHENVAIRIEGKARLVTVIVEPMPSRGSKASEEDGLFVLAFRDNGPASSGRKIRSAIETPADATQALEQELRTTKFQLQSSIDEFEVVNEEMRSSNEEYQSINEELQSANEELETAKEEIQSVNEELQTINAEMSSKNELLITLNSDLINLLDSTEIATIFLDVDLRIKSFTPGIVDIFPLREGDVGRPITEIVTLLNYADLQRDARAVVGKLSVIERQVSLVDAAMTFIMRIRPYRRVDRIVDGVVITFIDITEREAAEEALRASQDNLRLLIDSTADAIFCVDRDGVTTLCNAAFLRMLGFERQEDVIGKKLHAVMHYAHPNGAPYPESDSPINKAARTGEPAHVEDEVFFRRDGTSFPVEYWLRPLRHGGELQGAVCTFLDVSERQQAQERQVLLIRELDHRMKNLFAVTAGVVALSARSALTPQDMSNTVRGRLDALARAHRLILPLAPGDSDQRATTLGDLARAIIAPYADPQNHLRATIVGPEVAISGEAVTSLALVLHELATNAAKYGALSTAEGRIDIGWTISDGRLALVWEELGGPPIAGGAPEREGFGTLLARRSAGGNLDGDIAFDWRPEGLTVHLSAALGRLAK